jgi:RHS repeat-associated protein
MLLVGLPAGPAFVTTARAQASDPQGDLDDYQSPLAITDQNPDGTYSTEVHSAPVQFQSASGDWRPIDSSLVATGEDGYNFTNSANDLDVLLDAGASEQLLRVESDNASFDLRLDEAGDQDGVVAENRMTYPDVFPSTDLRYDVQSDGLKETLVLHGAGAPTSYRFTLTGDPEDGLDAQELPDGSWEFLSDTSDGPAFTLAPATVEDSSDPPKTGPAFMTVTEQGDEFAIDLGVESGWLSDPERVFPVLLDPTIVIQSPSETTDDVQYDWSATNGAPSFPRNLSVGTGNGGAKFRAGLKFDVSNIPPGAAVDSATLKLLWVGECITPDPNCNGAHTLDLHSINSWTTTAKPGFQSAALASYTLASGADAPKWMTFASSALTAKVATWVSGPNHGLLVKRSADSSAGLSGPLFRGRRTTDDDSVKPVLKVTWSSLGSTLEQPAAIHSSGADLAWTPFGGSGFTAYEVHRVAGSAGFQPGPQTLVATIKDQEITSYTDVTAAPGSTFSYEILTTYGGAPSGERSNKQTVVTPPLDGNGRAQTTLVLRASPSDTKAGFLTYYQTPGSNPPDKCNNFGNATWMRVGTGDSKRYRSLVWFDLRQVPPNATVSNAALKLYHNSTKEQFAVDVHRVTRPWREGSGTGECTGDGATWTETDGGVNWTSAGGDKSAQVATMASKDRSAPGWDSFDLKAPSNVLAPWLSGEEPNFGFMLKRAIDSDLDSGYNFAYFSDDYAAAPELRPRLELTYTDPDMPPPSKPSGSISSPRPGAVVSGTGASKTVTLRASAFDDGAVKSVQFLMGGSPLGAPDTSEPYELSWSTSSGVTNGAKSASVLVTDDAGQQYTSPAVTFQVDNSAPSVALASPGATVSGTKTLTATVQNATAQKVEFFVDSVLIGTDSAAAGGWTTSWNTQSATNPAYYGAHELSARAYFSSGLVTRSSIVAVNVDNSAQNNGFKGRLESGAQPSEVVKDPLLYDDDPIVDPTFEAHSLISGPRDTTAPEDTTNPTKGGRKKKNDPTLPPTEAYPSTVKIVNATGSAWHQNDYRVWYRWVNPQGQTVHEAPFGAKQHFDGALGAGVTTEVPGTVLPPSLEPVVSSARYELIFDVYHDDPQISGAADEYWLSAKGIAPVQNPVIVNRDLETKLGLEHYFGYERLSLGAGMSQLTNVANGNSLVTWSPFSLPGRGLATMVNLTYNSLEDHSESPVGNNFSLTTSSLVRIGEPLDLHANNGANAYVAFTDGDGTTHKFVTDGSGGWREPAGVNLYLAKVATSAERTWAVTRPDGTTFFFDSAGFPSFVRDPNNNEITFVTCSLEPNALNPCTENGDPLSRADDPGGPAKRIAAVRDPGGQDLTINYYTKNEVKNARVRGNIESITTHNDRMLRFDYYDDGNLKTLTQVGGTNADGSTLADRSFEFRYTENATSSQADNTNAQSARLYSVTDPRGGATVFDYYLSSEDGGGVSLIRYQLESVTDRLGNETRFTYDIVGRRTTVAAPLQRKTVYAYDVAGKVERIERELDPTHIEVTRQVWSNDFALETVIEPSGVQTDYTYNSNGLLRSVEDQEDHPTIIDYYVHCAVGEPVAGCSHGSEVKDVTSPDGDVTHFDYDSRRNLSKVTDPELNPTTYSWDVAGNLANITDANNHQTCLGNHDNSGLPRTVTEGCGTPESATTTMAFDPDGLLLSVQDPEHQQYSGGAARSYQSQFRYDSFGRLGIQSTPKSTKWAPGELIWAATAYDPNDNVTESFAPKYGRGFTRGSRSTVDYDAMDRPTKTTGPEQDSTTLVYDAAGRTTSVTSPVGSATTIESRDRSVQYGYDNFDRVRTETRHDNPASGPRSLTTTYCYQNLTGDLVATIPPEGVGTTCANAPRATRRTYYPDHSLESVTDPLGNPTKYDYYDDNTLLKVTDPENRVTQFEYDGRDLRTKVIESFDGTRKLTTVSEYDPVGNLSQVVSPRAWDTNPGKADYTETDPYVTTYTYDALNRQVKTSLPRDSSTDAAYSHTSYDRNGNVVWTSLPVTGSSTGQVPTGAKTEMTYLDPGWIRTSDDPTLPKARFDYSSEGWQTSRTPVVGGSPVRSEEMVWRYYPDGMLKSRNDQQGLVSSYKYDLDNLLTDATDVSGVSGPSEKRIKVSAAYDWAAQPTTVKQKKGDEAFKVTSFTYDRNGNVTTRDQDVPEAGGTATRKSILTYDIADWLDTQTIFGPKSGCADDRRIENDFFPTSREKFRRVYKGSGSGSSCTFSSLAQKTAWTYFENGKLKTLATTDDAGAVVESHSVGYISGGRYMNGFRTSDQFSLKLTGTGDDTKCSSASPCSASYAYDARDRLVNTYDGHGGRIAYSFDQPWVSGQNYGVKPPETRAGNVTTEEVFTGASSLTTGTVSKTTKNLYDSGQQVQSTIGTASTYYAYDDHGNLDCLTASQGVNCDFSSDAGAMPVGVLTDYTYDELDRLSAFRRKSPKSDSQYTYDALDRVSSQSETHATSATRSTDFSYIGLTTEIGTESINAGSVVKDFSYDTYGNRLTMTRTAGATSDPYTYAYDVHGSTSLLLDANSDVKASYGYSPYGDEDKGLTTTSEQVIDQAGAVKFPLNPYRYTAKRFDTGSGTLDMGARRFATGVSRFLQPDLFRGALSDLSIGSDPLTQNRYSLAGGNPLSFIEWDGHVPMADGSGTGGAGIRGGGGSDSSGPSFKEADRDTSCSESCRLDSVRGTSNADIDIFEAPELNAGTVTWEARILHDHMFIESDERDRDKFRFFFAWDTDAGELLTAVQASCRTSWLSRTCEDPLEVRPSENVSLDPKSSFDFDDVSFEGATLTFNFRANGLGPLPGIAPGGISGQTRLKVHDNEAELSGEHDRFPTHTIMVNNRVLREYVEVAPGLPGLPIPLSPSIPDTQFGPYRWSILDQP